MRRLVLLCVLVLAPTAGCGTVLDAPQGHARGGSVASASAAPSVSVSPAPSFHRPNLVEQTKRALMAPDALVKVGAPNRTEDTFDVDYGSSDYCNRSASDEGRTGHVAHRRLWRANGFNAVHVAHGYNLKLGKLSVDEARRFSAVCRTYDVTYTGGEKIKYDLLDVVDLGVVAEADDHFAICEKRTHGSGATDVACSAYLGRDHLLAHLIVLVSADVAAARTKLIQIVPIAAAALAAAA